LTITLKPPAVRVFFGKIILNVEELLLPQGFNGTFLRCWFAYTWLKNYGTRRGDEQFCPGPVLDKWFGRLGIIWSIFRLGNYATRID
jgi:hypothetical protein